MKPRWAGRHSSLVMGSLRERGTITLVGALTGFYGTVMVYGADLLRTAAGGLGGTGLSAMLLAVNTVFIGIALYVGGVVIAGCVATVIAGRLQHIATLRLLGSTAAQLRRSIGQAAAGSAALGALLGTLLAAAACLITRHVLVDRGSMPDLPYSAVPLPIVAVLLAIVVMAQVAGWSGSRKVLSVPPAAAFSGMTVPATATTRRVRLGVALVLTVGGVLTLLCAAWLGERGSAAGFVFAFFGGIALMSGIISGAPWFVPVLVRTTSVIAGRTAPARIARRNAVADRMRTARSTIGLIVGVTLVVTFMSGAASLGDSVNSWTVLQPEQKAIALQILDLTGKLLTAIVAVSSVIAAVGFVSTMSLVVLQRRREIGLLRSLGLTTQEIRAMVTIESLALGITAVLFGVFLGTVFGVVGTQALIGALNDGLVIGLPWTTVAAVTVCAVALVLISALPPARRANRLSPVEALRL